MVEQKHKYDFQNPISENAIKFIKSSINNSFAVDSLHIDSNGITILFNEGILADEFNGLIRKLLFISRNINSDLIFSHNSKSELIIDVYPQLETKMDVRRVAPGTFMFQGEFLKVAENLNYKVRDLARSFDAKEQEYPVLWPIDLYRRINYFQEFPQQAILCSTVKHTKQARDSVANKYSTENNYQSVDIRENFTNATFGLQSAVCDCCYYMLENETRFKNSSFTCYNKVFRNEVSPRGRLERLTNFSVRDIMFVGTSDFVLENRQKVFELLQKFVHSLELSCSLETATDPFFVGDAISKSAFQYASKLKHELLFDLPGIEGKMAIGSVNFHMDFFGRAFNICLENGSLASSGCIGIGMERFTYALFCQHGSHLKNWPIAVLDFLELR